MSAHDSQATDSPTTPATPAPAAPSYQISSGETIQFDNSSMVFCNHYTIPTTSPQTSLSRTSDGRISLVEYLIEAQVKPAMHNLWVCTARERAAVEKHGGPSLCYITDEARAQIWHTQIERSHRDLHRAIFVGMRVIRALAAAHRAGAVQRPARSFVRFGVEKGESPYDPEGAGAGIKSPNAVAVAASVGRCRTDSGFHDMEKVWVVVLGEEMESAVRTATEVYFASVPAFGREEGEDDFPAAGGNRALGAWGWYSESKSKPM